MFRLILNSTVAIRSDDTEKDTVGPISAAYDDPLYHAAEAAGNDRAAHAIEACRGAADAADLVHQYSRLAGDDEFDLAGMARGNASQVVDITARSAWGINGIWEQVREDARLSEAEEDSFKRRLWSVPHPDWFGRRDEQMRAIWMKEGAEIWSFWLRWWDGVVSGRPLPWDLQEKVALIPDEVWDQGAEAVAAEIARIEEQFRLQHEVARLNEELAVARADIVALTNRGHNNPPELLHPVGEIERHANEIGAALNEAEAELARAAPRAAVLNRVGRVLLSISAKSLAYCASLGDAVLKKAAEELGSSGAKALIGAGLVGWVSHLEAVQELARALRAFAQMFGSG
jgi:uncharacterized protein (DUF1697 family)